MPRKRRNFEFETNAEIRAKIVDVCQWLLAEGHNLYSSGNVSHRGVEKGTLLLTPSQVPYDQMQPEDIVLVNLEDNAVLEGKRNPSSEAKFHNYIYRARRKINCIIHTHSVYATTMAILRLDLPPVIEEVIPQVGVSKDLATSVKVAEYGRAGSEELANNIVAALGRTSNVTFVANHGVVCVGKNFATAIRALEYTERAARIYLMARAVGTEVFALPEETKKYERDLYRVFN